MASRVAEAPRLTLSYDLSSFHRFQLTGYLFDGFRVGGGAR